MASDLVKQLSASNFTRIQGGASEVTIGCDVVHRIVAAVPTAGSGGTVTVEDGTDVMLVFEVGADALKTLELEYEMTGDLNVTPEDASIDVVVFWS